MSYIKFKACHPSNYRAGRSSKIQYIVIHYTGNNGDTAKGNCGYYSRTPRLSASAHYYVDEYDEVWQSVDANNTAWHCGALTYVHHKCRNENSISIEMCSRTDKNGTYYIMDETKNNAAILVRELMQKYNIPISNVIRHYDVTGKNCPAPFVKYPSKWIDFKSKLNIEESEEEDMDGQAIYDRLNEHLATLPTSDYAEESCRKGIESGIFADGDGDGLVDNPQGMLTREQLAVILNRAGILDNLINNSK